MNSIPVRAQSGIPTIRRLIGELLLFAIAFGLVGLFAGLREAAKTTLPFILTPGDYINFQEISDGLPVPLILHWNLPLIGIMLTLRDIQPPGYMILFGLILFGLAVISIHIIWPGLLSRGFHPTLHSQKLPIEAVSSNPSQESENETIKPIVSPDDGIEPLSDFEAFDDKTEALQEYEPKETTVQIPTHENALTDKATEDTRDIAAPANLNVVRNRLVAVAIYLVSLFLLIRVFSPQPLEKLTPFYPSLGTFNVELWQESAGCFIASLILNWLVAGILLYAIARTGLRLAQRFTFVSMAFSLILLSLAIQFPIQINRLMPKRDWDATAMKTDPRPFNPARPIASVPNGKAAAELFATRAKLTLGEQPSQQERMLILHAPEGIFILNQHGVTEDGITADINSARLAENYLADRKYRSSLAWVAVNHQYGVATIHFDTTQAMRVCLLDLERAPHMTQCNQTLRSMLAACSASHANLDILNEWADERKFVFQTRDCRKFMGDLYARMGAAEQALAWYKKADMPETFMAKVKNARPIFNRGHVSGTLILNGKPVEGVQIGVIPHRLNGLPKDLELPVLDAYREIESEDPYSEDFPSYNPRPYTFRWISASSITDKTGAFSIDNLTQGDYLLIYTLPSNIKLKLPFDPALNIKQPVKPIAVSYETPDCNLGNIELTIKE